MEEVSKPQVYRALIDELVDVLQHGQGQIGARRVRAGIWNPNARPDDIEDQYAINELLSRLSSEDREIIARMLVDEVERGMFETLKALEHFRILPFASGYEGSPYEDFIGRVSGDWEWPE